MKFFLIVFVILASKPVFSGELGACREALLSHLGSVEIVDQGGLFNFERNRSLESLFADLEVPYSKNQGLSFDLTLSGAREALLDSSDLATKKLEEDSSKLIEAALEQGSVEVDYLVVGSGPTTANFLRGLTFGLDSKSKKPRVLVVSENLLPTHYLEQNYLMNSAQPVSFGLSPYYEVNLGFRANPIPVEGLANISDFSFFTGIVNGDAWNEFSQRSTWATPFSSYETQSLHADENIFISEEGFESFVKSQGGKFVELPNGPEPGGIESLYPITGLVYMPVKIFSQLNALSLFVSNTPIITGVRVNLPIELSSGELKSIETSLGFSINIADGGKVIIASGTSAPLGKAKSFSVGEGADKYIETNEDFLKRLMRFNNGESSESIYDDYAGKSILVMGRGDSGNVFMGGVLGAEVGIPEIPESLGVTLSWSKLENQDPKHFLEKLNKNTEYSRGLFHDLRYEALSSQLHRVRPVDKYVSHVEVTEDGSVMAKFDDGSFETYDLIVDQTPQISNLPVGKVEAFDVELSDGFYGGQNATVALKYEGTPVFLIGPSVIPTLNHYNKSVNFTPHPIGNQYGFSPFVQGATEYFPPVDSSGTYYFPNPTALISTAPLVTNLGLHFTTHWISENGE